MRLFHLLVLSIFAFCVTVSAQIPAKRYSPDFTSSDPYGLANADLDHFDSPDYPYSKWGVLLDAASVSGSSVSLQFTKLTTWLPNPLLAPVSPPVPLSETDLFVNAGTSILSPYNAGWFQAAFTNPGLVTFGPGAPNLISSNTYALIRKFHFPSSLTDEFGRSLGIGTKKAIVLIHGWNPASDDNSYDELVDDKEFRALRDNLVVALAGSDWNLFTYHWEKDADTGPSITLEAGINGSEAAEVAHRHGQHLGELLDRVTGQQLEKVHFIAHSAGSWTARAATKYLLSARKNSPLAPPITVQLTLLDPFIPGALSAADLGRVSYLTTSDMSDIYNFAGASSASLYRLENYYAKDTDQPLNGGGSIGTQEIFGWRAGIDLDLRLDASASVYDSHAGPILFYGDTVADAVGASSLPGSTQRLAGAGFGNVTHLYGWQRSLFYREPVITLQPTAAPVVVGGSIELVCFAELRGGQNFGKLVESAWESSIDGGNTWVTYPTGAIPTLNFRVLIKNISAADHGKQFRCKISTNAGVETSNPVAINVIGGTPTAPAAPSDLTTPSVTSSQINLTWSDNSNNETGFSIEQRNPDGSWPTAGVKSADRNATSASITGLTAKTSYTFRVRAKNGALVSGPSNERTITTGAPAGTNFTLNIASSNPASDVSVASMLGTGGYVSATTPTSRSFAVGSVVTVTCPRTLVSGKIFQKWQLDGVDHDFDDVAVVTMDAAHTLTAVYGTSAPPARTLTSLAIEGASSVDENDSETYKARVSYSDGSTALVSGVDWDEDSSYASISSGGVLDADAVSSDKSVTVTASYTAGGTTRTASKSVTEVL